MPPFLQNLRFAIRQLLRNRGFAAGVIVTLALAIGANTAIFSIVNALLLERLPYPDPNSLGTIFRHVEGSEPFDGPHAISGRQYELLRDQVPSLIAAVSGTVSGVNLQAGTRVAFVQDGRISQHYLDVLGIHVAAGRNFTASEDTPHGPNAAILSYDLWRDTFDSDVNIVGQAIHLKGDLYTVVGVLPQAAALPVNAEIYSPLQPSTQGEGSGSNYSLITRLRDGANWQQADAEINRAWASEAVMLASQNRASKVSFYSRSLRQGETASLRPKALALMFAAGFILLIACANLAGLTLVQMLRRTPEIATRLALGASRWQIQQQLWVDNLVLAAVGGAAAIAVGFLALRGLLSILPVGFLPVAAVHMDRPVLAFTFTVAILTSILFGMLPSLVSRKIDLRSAIASRGGANVDRLRLRQILIAGEVALTVVLLAGSGLLIRTLVHLQTLPPGFDAQGVMTAKASLNDVRFNDPATFRRFLDESTASLLRIPGVQNAAVGLTLPYERTLNEGLILSDGKEAGKRIGTDFVYVTPGYFDTLRIPLLAGRAFTPSDGPNTQMVAIVNQSFAEKFYHGQNPIGRILNKGVVIVGVVGDVQLSSGLNWVAPLQTEETLYVPAAQMVQPQYLALLHTWFQPSWIVRTSGPIQGLTGQMQRAMSAVDQGVPFSGFYRMSDLQTRTLSTQRIEVVLLGAIAALALLMSAVGVFSLVSNVVAQKTREIGIRIALGSTVRSAMVHVGTPGIQASLLGLLLGLALSIGALRVLQHVLYGVQVYDAVTLLAATAILALAASAATILPTFRVAKIAPAQTLREE